MSATTPRVGAMREQAYSARASYAAIRRHHPDHPELADEALLRLKLLRAEDYLRDLVTTAPPLTDAHRAHLAVVLLRDPAGGDGNVAA